METIDMKIYEPVPGKKGLVREVGFRKAKDVFQELEERLRQLGLYPDEYFVLNSPYDDKGALFPETVTMHCYANWGGSEGIYLEVDLIAVEDGKLVRRNFATGKSLAEDGDSFDRLQYTAGVIYKLFYGERFMPTRYFLLPQDEKQNMNVLQSRVEREFRDFVKKLLVHNNERGEEFGMAIGLRAMILAELPQCTVPPDKLKELMDSENALELLTKICEPVCEPNKFEINDLISSCDSFVKELERRREQKLFGKSLAARLVDFYKNYDHYDYHDSLEVGETDEDAIKRMEHDLTNRDAVCHLIEKLREFSRDEDLDAEQEGEITVLLEDLMELYGRLTAGHKVGDENGG